MTRKYHIELPYHIPAMFVSTAIDRMKQIGEWEKLPQELKDKAEASLSNWYGLDLTQEDLDAIPTRTWKVIAINLNIEWE